MWRGIEATTIDRPTVECIGSSIELNTFDRVQVTDRRWTFVVNVIHDSRCFSSHRQCDTHIYKRLE